MLKMDVYFLERNVFQLLVIFEGSFSLIVIVSIISIYHRCLLWLKLRTKDWKQAVFELKMLGFTSRRGSSKTRWRLSQVMQEFYHEAIFLLAGMCLAHQRIIVSICLVSIINSTRRFVSLDSTRCS